MEITVSVRDLVLRRAGLKGMTITMELKIKLVRSLSGRNRKHILTARSLGLKTVGDETLQPDSACTRGKINQINYLVVCEEISGNKNSAGKEA